MIKKSRFFDGVTSVCVETVRYEVKRIKVVEMDRDHGNIFEFNWRRGGGVWMTL